MRKETLHLSWMEYRAAWVDDTGITTRVAYMAKLVQAAQESSILNQNLDPHTVERVHEPIVCTHAAVVV